MKNYDKIIAGICLITLLEAVIIYINFKSLLKCC